MSARLAESLVAKGVVTEEQARGAQDHALIHGGSLCEALVEFGAVDDAALANFIAREFDLGFVSSDLLELIDPEMMSTVPADMAEEFRAIPIDFSGDTLEVAMIDPLSDRARDELAFFTGYKIHPLVATASSISGALRRYYGVHWNVKPPSLASAEQTVLVNWEAVRPAQDVAAASAAAPESPPTSVPEPAPATVPDLLAAAEPTSVSAPAPAPASASASAPASAPAAVPPSAAQAPQRERAPISRPVSPPLRSVEAELVDEIVGLVHEEDGTRPQSRAREEAAPPLSFDDALGALDAARDRTEIARAAISALRCHVDRVLLATQKGELLVGWDGHGEGLTKHKIRSLLVPLSLPSPFQRALISTDLVEELPGEGPIDLFLRAFLGGPSPARIAVAPVVARGQTIAFAYTDIASGSRASPAEAVVAVCDGMGRAFSRLLGDAPPSP